MVRREGSYALVAVWEIIREEWETGLMEILNVEESYRGSFWRIIFDAPKDYLLPSSEIDMSRQHKNHNVYSWSVCDVFNAAVTAIKIAELT